MIFVKYGVFFLVFYFYSNVVLAQYTVNETLLSLTANETKEKLGKKKTFEKNECYKILKLVLL